MIGGAWRRAGTCIAELARNLIGLDCHLYCWIHVRNFHEVAPNAIQGATATVRGSLAQVAMTGYVGLETATSEGETATDHATWVALALEDVRPVRGYPKLRRWMHTWMYPMEEAMDDGWASMMIRRRDEECVRNANAPSCPLLEEGMSATCIGIDRYTDRRHER